MFLLVPGSRFPIRYPAFQLSYSPSTRYVLFPMLKGRIAPQQSCFMGWRPLDSQESEVKNV